jgi:hypothetical protein
MATGRCVVCDSGLVDAWVVCHAHLGVLFAFIFFVGAESCFSRVFGVGHAGIVDWGVSASSVTDEIASSSGSV